jgi:uncharacterized surface protein with fasciclin (FAS1) repeats
VFAPTDEAFAKLPAGTVENLLKPENKAKLTAILTYHVVPGAVKAEQVMNCSDDVIRYKARLFLIGRRLFNEQLECFSFQLSGS